MKRVVLLLVAGILAGCSSEKKSTSEKLIPMDKNIAAQEIRISLKIEEVDLFVQVGRVGRHCVEKGLYGNSMENSMDPESDLNTIIAKRAGYVTVVPDGKGFWKVTLTDQGNTAMAQGSEGKPFAHNSGAGCDYQQVDFPLATPELVDVTDLSADQIYPKADYTWKWKPTELGQALRQDGRIYRSLNSVQRVELGVFKRGIAEMLPMPVPPEDYTKNSTATFKRDKKGWTVL
jgi:hypothetical protein